MNECLGKWGLPSGLNPDVHYRENGGLLLLEVSFAHSVFNGPPVYANSIRYTHVHGCRVLVLTCCDVLASSPADSQPVGSDLRRACSDQSAFERPSPELFWA